jgi:hypothetical protein
MVHIHKTYNVMHQTHSSDVIISSTLFVSSISKPCIVPAMFVPWDRHLAKHRLLMHEKLRSWIIQTPFGCGTVVWNFSGTWRAEDHEWQCHVIRGDVHNTNFRDVFIELTSEERDDGELPSDMTVWVGGVALHSKVATMLMKLANRSTLSDRHSAANI